MKVLLVPIFCLFLSLSGGGCDKASDNKIMTYDYPPDIANLCVKAREDAKRCVESVVGHPLELNNGCRVEKVPGVKKGKNGWGWWSEDYNCYVCGLCGYIKRQYYIKIGVNPQTGLDINMGSLTHENGHYWINSNNLDEGQMHNQKFASCFASWNNPPSKKLYFETKDGWEIIDLLELEDQ
jgi:hypothetical protein